MIGAPKCKLVEMRCNVGQQGYVREPKLKKVGCQWKVVCTEGSDCQTCHIGYSDLRAPSKAFL